MRHGARHRGDVAGAGSHGQERADQEEEEVSQGYYGKSGTHRYTVHIPRPASYLARVRLGAV